MIATINFINVPVKNPKKDPNAAFEAVSKSALLINSPTRAPKKGPIIIPPGIGAKIPMNKPIDVPIIPALVPPKRLVPIAGIT